MFFEFVAMNPEHAEHFRSGGRDANDQTPVPTISDGDGNPCRQCLRDIPKGRKMLVLAYRPFGNVHPYAETGPVFLCASPCESFGRQAAMPPVIASREAFILRGYDSREVIVGGTGRITPTADIPARLSNLFANKQVHSVHIRSASNNCYFCKVEMVD